MFKILAAFAIEKYNNTRNIFVQMQCVGNQILCRIITSTYFIWFTFLPLVPERMSSGGWCGRGDRPRVFPSRPAVICYDSPPAAKVSCIHYDNLRLEALMGEKIQELTVPKKSAATWEMKERDLCRITVTEGSQVGFFSISVYKQCIQPPIKWVSGTVSSGVKAAGA
jgi:hypothetical protein